MLAEGTGQSSIPGHIHAVRYFCQSYGLRKFQPPENSGLSDIIGRRGRLKPSVPMHIPLLLCSPIASGGLVVVGH
jgi:hypothetical protein